MAGERIDSILVKEAIEKELQFLAGNLDELAAKIKTFPAIRTKTEGANNVKELSKAQIQYAESLKAVEQLVKQRMSSEAKLITLQSDYAVAISKNRTEVQKMNREQKIAAEIALSQEGSIERARAKIKALTLEQSKLNLVTADGRKRNDEINKSLEKYTEFIRKNVSAAEKQRMNVGNYQGSAKIIVDALERARMKVQQVERDFGKIGPEARRARGEFEALRQITEDQRFLNISAKVGDTNKELRFFTQQLNALEDAGMKNSKVYNDVRARLAQLTDQIADTKAEVKALASDTRNFDLFAGSVNFAADAFQTFAGAAALAGASEEEVAAQIRTLVAVQSVANGVKGIANELTTQGTAANKVYAFVQGLVATSLDKTAAAGTRAKAALGLLGIAVTVIGAVVIALSQMNNKLGATEQAQKDYNDAVKEGTAEATNQIGQLRSLYAVSQDVTQSLKTRREATDKINEINKANNEATGQNIKLLTDQNGILKEQPELIDKISESLIRQAKTKAVLQLIEKGYTQLIQAQTESLTSQTNKLEDAAIKTNNVIAKFLNPFNTGLGPKGVDLGKLQKGIKEAGVKDADAYLKTLQEILSNGLKSGELSLDGIFGDKKTGKTTADKDIKDRAKIRMDALKTQLEAEAALQRQIVEIESFSLSERQQALRDYVRLKTNLINAEADYELSKSGQTAEEIKAIEADKVQAMVNLGDEARNMFKVTIKAAAEDVKDDLGDITDEVTAVMDQMNAELEAGFIAWSKNLNGNLTDQQKQMLEDTKNLYIDTYQTIADTAGSVVAGLFDRQKNAIQDQIDNIDRLKAAEIDRINASADSEEKKAAKVKLIEAKAQADKEALARRQREIDRQRAIAERAFKLFQITTDTIQAVNKIKMLIAAAPDPISKAFYASQLVQAIVGGAASAISLMATPIPKFWKGTDSAPEGPAEVAERGRELAVDPKGRLTLYDKPQITHLMKGTKIFPNDVTEKIIQGAEAERRSLTSAILINNGNDNSKAIEEQTKILKRIEGKPPVTIFVHPAVDIDWFNKQMKY